jgi:hypothetical protein
MHSQYQIRSRRAQLTETFWARHSNPWSGWSRTLGHPALVAALSARNWRVVAGCVVYFIVNPLLFPPPQDTDNWMSKGVLGERLWTSGYNPQHWRLPNWLNAVNVPIFIGSLVAAYQRKPGPTILATLLTAVTKLWFIDRMVQLYNIHQQEQVATQTPSVPERSE